MKRRDFINFLVLAAIGQGMGAVRALAGSIPSKSTGKPPQNVFRGIDGSQVTFSVGRVEKDACALPADMEPLLNQETKKSVDALHCRTPKPTKPPHVQASEYRKKMQSFNRPSPGDIYVPSHQRPLLKSCVARLKRVYQMVGHTNFYLLSIDDARNLARDHHRIGPFPGAEIQFLESIFSQDATVYGFYGARQINAFTHKIPKKAVAKVPRSGNYLYKERSLALYQRLHQDIGSKAILTSGVRGVVKQSYLFLRKAQMNQGNLSLASRSIAPPGYSYHGIGDFDIGQVGLGADNFSARFIQSQVFKKLLALDYVCLRYTENNPFGVRFEPWHVMVQLSG